MKAIITGGSGFIGTYLAKELISEGYEVISADLNPRDQNKRIDGVDYRILDISSEHQVSSLIEESRPDLVFHLAAQPYPSVSWQDPENTFKINVLGTVYLFEAIRKLGKSVPTVVASSSASYGDLVSYPTGERSVLNPLSPYGVSKAVQDMLVYQYFRSYDLPFYSLRLFGTTGPGKTGDVVNDFASQIVNSEQTGDIVKVGNLETIRDLSDVRDVVKAFFVVRDNGAPGQSYNVGSGKQYKIKDLLHELLGLAVRDVKVAVDSMKFRPSDEYIIVSDISKIRSIGYRPKISMSKTLKDVMTYWRKEGYGTSEIKVPLIKGHFQKDGPMVSTD